MKQNETTKILKISKNLIFCCCEKCDYNTYCKADFKKHTLTLKHKNRENETLLKQMKQNETTSLKKSQKYVCNCGLIYNSRTTLWRHKQSCTYKEQINEEPLKNMIYDKELVLMLIKQNTELLEIVKNGTNNNNSNNTNTNSLNKTFNLQFFLNETCKDAMNMTDFVESIKIQLHDLEKMGDIGYVQGLSNIITTNLKILDITQRPFHCTDPKRETIYIKNDNLWEKEDDNKTKLRKIINKIAYKNIKILPQFREKYPDYNNSSLKISDTYDKLVIEAMGGKGDNDSEKENKIIKKLAKELLIDK